MGRTKTVNQIVRCFAFLISEKLACCLLTFDEKREIPEWINCVFCKTLTGMKNSVAKLPPSVHHLFVLLWSFILKSGFLTFNRIFKMSGSLFMLQSILFGIQKQSSKFKVLLLPHGISTRFRHPVSKHLSALFKWTKPSNQTDIRVRKMKRPLPHGTNSRF